MVILNEMMANDDEDLVVFGVTIPQQCRTWSQDSTSPPPVAPGLITILPGSGANNNQPIQGFSGANNNPACAQPGQDYWELQPGESASEPSVSKQMSFQ